MASDQSLATLLRALHSPTNEQDASRLLGTATTLLTLLSNPLNITLLTSQILIAPAVWLIPDGLQTSLRVLGVFNGALRHVLHRESTANRDVGFSTIEGLGKDEWVKAVVKGADDRSPRWKHLLVLGGLLVGSDGFNVDGLSASMTRILHSATVMAANFALQDTEGSDELGANSLCLVLGHVHDLLYEDERLQINHNSLLPLLMQAILFSRDGLHWGYFVGGIDADVVQDGSTIFNWSTRSTSFFRLQKLASSPLVACLGPLARLAAISVERVTNIDAIFQVAERLSAFTRSLSIQWQQNKLSEVDVAEEAAFLSSETLEVPLPLLWRVFKACMFAIVVIQRSLLGRVLGDGGLPAKQAPFLAIQTLHALRDIYFISSRLGHNSFSQYTFVFMTSIDILSRYSVQSETFLQDIRPCELGRIPAHPHERGQDLFFLNTAEHFPFCLTPRTNEELLIAAASPYLGIGSDPRLFESFEAAHSVMLAVFLARRNQEVTTNHLPFYVDTLFQVFPRSLTPRQFRLAVKTLVSITAPPSPIYESQPLLSSTLLEIVHFRAKSASPARLPPLSRQHTDTTKSLSEQAVMVLALIDCLSVLPLDALGEWLPLTAEILHVVNDQTLLQLCQARFWDVLNSGEMDIARSEVCVAWWNTKGGRAMVFPGRYTISEEPWMSGALQEVGKL